MTIPSYAAKRDTAEPEIVDALEAAGATVWKLSGTDLPDLLVGYRGQNHLVEVKTGRAGLRFGQAQAFHLWRGEPVHVVRTAAEAQILIDEWLIDDLREDLS